MTKEMYYETMKGIRYNEERMLEMINGVDLIDLAANMASQYKYDFLNIELQLAVDEGLREVCSTLTDETDSRGVLDAFVEGATIMFEAFALSKHLDRKEGYAMH